MIAYFMLGIALLLSLLLLTRRLTTVDPRLLAKGVRYGGGAAAAVAALYLIVSGRWPLAMMAASAVLPLVSRGWPFRGWSPTQTRPSPGKQSEVTTRLLRVTLDHDSGDMSGEVIGGAKSGRSLESLGRLELLALLEECRAEDGESVPLLEAYLDRRFGSDWREAGESRGHGDASGDGDQAARGARNTGPMARREALEVLGLEEGADRDAIKDAYRRLMVKLHPDAGGSAYLAAKLNAAKELLLGE